MTQELMSIKDSILTASTQALNHLITFLPTMLGALILLTFGWMLSHLIGKGIEKVLLRFGFEKAAKKSGVLSFIEQSGTNFTASELIGELSKWFIRLIFIQASASIVAMPQVTQVISNVILFIPKVIVAVVILIAGSLVARFLSRAVHGSAAKIGVEPKFLARVTYYAIMGFSVIGAFSQLEIAANIVNTLFMGFVASIALAFGLAFGLGGRDVAGDITRRWYDNAKKDEKSRLRKVG